MTDVSSQRLSEKMGSQIAFQYAVYFLPTAPLDMETSAKATVMAVAPKIQIVEEHPESNSQASPLLVFDYEKDAPANYAPMGADSLSYFGRGLSDEQATAFGKSKEALILSFYHPRSDAFSMLAKANSIVYAIAKTTGGIIWDEDTREVFTPEAWKERRLVEPPIPEFPDVTRQITIHAYPMEGDSDGYVRAITLGMGKFGLPDIVASKFSWSEQRAVGNLINLLAQILIEGEDPRFPGDIEVDCRVIKNEAVREAQLEAIGNKENATGIAELRLAKTTPGEGDPVNLLVEIDFSRGSGPDIHAQRDSVLSSIYGSTDGVKMVQHNDEVVAASERAREKLDELFLAFQAKLPPGETLMLKSPFDTPDGQHEWMWIDVTEWDQKEKIKGLLNNEPFFIPELHAGQLVEIEAKNVFDYIRYFADGTSEGNETGKIIRRLKDESQK